MRLRHYWRVRSRMGQRKRSGTAGRLIAGYGTDLAASMQVEEISATIAHKKVTDVRAGPQIALTILSGVPCGLAAANWPCRPCSQL